MQDLLNQLGDIADRIKILEGSREKLGRFLREAAARVELSGEVAEPRLIYSVAPDALAAKRIAAIDGGLSQHEYHGLDIILTRAVGVVFDYRQGKLEKVAYHPHALVNPRIVVVADPTDEQEFAASSSLERQRGEIELAAAVFKQFSPDMLLLDGSVVPHGNDRPSRTSAAWQRYEAVISAFKNLFAASAGRLLAGCCEDSRGRHFCEIVAEQILGQVDSPRVPELQKILAGTRDTNLLYHILKPGERTAVFKFSKNPSQHPVLSDLGNSGNQIYSFYLKTAEFDRPVRVDFYGPPDKNDGVISIANKIASLVLAVTPHQSYGFPSPLIEADFRAKLQERDVDALHDQLVDRVGITPSLMKLRREQRPF